MKNQLLSRRTVLRGLGTMIALPWLESMGSLTTWAAGASGKKTAPNRMAFLYVPNGKDMANWTPSADGALGSLPPILSALSPVKNDLLVLTGLAPFDVSEQLVAMAAAGGVPLTADQTRVIHREVIAAMGGQATPGGEAPLTHTKSAIVEALQRGTRSRFYRKGRYSPTRETGTHHFHRLLCEFMNGDGQE